MTMLTPKEKKDGARDLEQLADEAATKYRENPGMRPQELFLLGASWAKEQDKAEIEKLKSRIAILEHIE